VTEERILEVWKTILSRHTLLWSTVKFEDYYNIHFVYVPHPYNSIQAATDLPEPPQNSNRIPQDSAEFDEIARARMEIKTGMLAKGKV